tara:strand:+ start:1394 stop:1804 length:411 start_codon:yes stop_codon:yes gene_type:complete
MNDLVETLEEIIEQCDSMITTVNSAMALNDLDWNMKARVRAIRNGLEDAKRTAEELIPDLQKRVYCIAVTTEVEQVIKVLAKNEDDAIREAIETVDIRIDHTLGSKYGIEYHSDACSHGDESPEDDEADIEVHYDE